MITKHPLTIEFPELADKIHILKVENAFFKKLFETYDALDHEIYNAESDIQPTSDEGLNQMRLERVKLKDEIYQFLLNN